MASERSPTPLILTPRDGAFPIVLRLGKGLSRLSVKDAKRIIIELESQVRVVESKPRRTAEWLVKR